MKLNDSRSPTLEGQSFWQQAKHAMLYSDLFQTSRLHSLTFLFWFLIIRDTGGRVGSGGKWKEGQRVRVQPHVQLYLWNSI